MCPSMCTVQSTRSATLMWETFPFTSVLCAVPELHHLPNRLISNYITTRKGPSKRGDGIFFFSQGSVGRRIGSSRMEKNRKRGNDDKTQTRDAPYWFPLLLLLLFFVFSIIRKLIGRVVLRCWWCCALSRRALSNRTRQGPISSWHFVFYHSLAPSYTVVAGLANFPVASLSVPQPWK